MNGAGKEDGFLVLFTALPPVGAGENLGLLGVLRLPGGVAGSVVLVSFLGVLGSSSMESFARDSVASSAIIRRSQQELFRGRATMVDLDLDPILPLVELL